MDSIEEVLSFCARVTGIYGSHRKRFVAEILSINLSDNFRTNLVTGGVQFQTRDGGARKGFESGLRVRDDFPIHDVSHRIEQQVCSKTRNRHSLAVQQPASNDHIERTVDE